MSIDSMGNLHDIWKSFCASGRKIIVMAGMTASGKSAVSDEIARLYGGRIINADSMQVYSEFSAITARPAMRDNDDIVRKLYGFISVFEDDFSVPRWLTLAENEIADALRCEEVPIMVGGTGMYLHAMIDGFSEVPFINRDKVNEMNNIVESLSRNERVDFLTETIGFESDAAMRVVNLDRQRMVREIVVLQNTGKPLSYWHAIKRANLYSADDFFTILTRCDRDILKERIVRRIDISLEDIIVEVADLISKVGVADVIRHCYKVIGVQEVVSYLSNAISKDELRSQIILKTCQYAKRQRTWFRNKMRIDCYYDVEN